DVAGGEGCAVVEDDILAQLEGPSDAVGGDFPAFGEHGFDAAGEDILVGEALEDALSEIGGAGFAGDYWVEARGLAEGGADDVAAVFAGDGFVLVFGEVRLADLGDFEGGSGGLGLADGKGEG